MLYRLKNDRVIAGVCSGIAKKYHLKRWGVRTVAIVLALFYGIAILVYIILWLVLESK